MATFSVVEIPAPSGLGSGEQAIRQPQIWGAVENEYTGTGITETETEAPTLILAIYWRATLRRSGIVRSTQFGDSYQERVADSINAPIKIWEIRANGITAAEGETFDTELAGYQGVTAFHWHPQGTETTDLYTCKPGDWSIEYWGEGYCDAVATFTQVYA